MSRLLTAAEHELTKWLLENGKPEAKIFLPQLERALASDWTCPCSCASFNLEIDGNPTPIGVTVLSDYVFGEGDSLCGIFAWESNGVLAGVEVYGLPGDAPNILPAQKDLRPFENSVASPES